MISDKKKNLNNTIYGRANLPSRLDMTTNSTTYIYDANDMRIYKKVDSLDTVLKEEYYLRDATGRELAVIDNNYNINWYIYGKERVASMHHEMPVGLEKLFITGNIPGGKHYAPDRLSTDGTVQSDATLEAGDKVSMLPGFNAPADAEFKADIKKPDGIPNFIYYLYDHLGNTRVTYSVDLYVEVGVDAMQVKRTVESATDYYPYGKALRSFGKERYQSTYHERDVESGFDYRGARFYDSDVARFNSLDPLAADYPGLSDYVYVAGNPLMFVDPDGRKVFVSGHLTNADGDYIRDENGALIPAEGYAVDENGNYIESQESLLIMHRAPLSTELSDKYTNVWKVTFSLKVGNRERKLRTPDGTATMYMFGNKKWDEKGSNYLPKKAYKLEFETMTNRPYTNSIRITSFGVFIHPASTYEPIFGCKGLCATYKSVKDDDRVTDIFFGQNTKDALQQVRALYDIYEKNLTGDKFILKTNSEAPKDLGMPVKPLINK